MITGGTIEFEQRIKTGEFEHKVAKAVITFSVPEDAQDAEAQAAKAAEMAQANVYNLLGLKSGRTVAKPPTDKDALAAKVVEAAKPKPPTPKVAVADDFDVVTPLQARERPPEPVKVADPLEDDVLTSAPPAPVDDVELTKQIGLKNKELQNPHLIRELIGKYVPNDGLKHQAVEIAPEKRGAFLKELGALKKPA